MNQHHDQFDRAEMSEAPGVSRSGYYRVWEAKSSKRRQADEDIKAHIPADLSAGDRCLWLIDRSMPIWLNRR